MLMMSVILFLNTISGSETNKTLAALSQLLAPAFEIVTKLQKIQSFNSSHSRG